ncbi:outer membrane lipoprotein [Rickettsia endosymbiont of Orchestes rusci]|uniref:outer membrane lipoprotein n=1 Tax=Rickettsia endosymbiont of Orchestes rusci TaxID=3066250 RepID=UPI00313A9D3A
MKKLFCQCIIFIILTSLLTGCARDLSSNVYTSDSTLNLTLEGEVLSIRPVIIKESDRLSDNSGGMLAGGVMGGVLGSGVGQGTGNAAAIVGGAIVGAALGSGLQGKLGEKKGYEYLVKVDTSKIKSDYYEGNSAMRNVISTAVTSGLITVVQATDSNIKIGQKVYIIFSEKRTRVIPA